MKAKTAILVRPQGRRRTIALVDRASEPASKSARQQMAQIAPAAEKPLAASFSPLRDFLGVYVDPRTWGAAFYILVSFVTGILYFTWAVTGLGLSIGFLILVIGLPFAFLFLLSVRGIALVEARLVQASLGTGTAPAPIFRDAGLKWWARLKALVTDRSTWSAMLYLILQLPLGTIYFCVTFTLTALALALISAPLLYVLTPMPVLSVAGEVYRLPFWAPVLIAMGGFLLLTAAMHMIRGIGRWHGRYAKALLGS